MILELALLSIKILTHLGILSTSLHEMFIFEILLFNGPFTVGVNSPKVVGTKSLYIEELGIQSILLKLDLGWLTRQEHKDSQL